jgi:hypothetical protein
MSKTEKKYEFREVRVVRRLESRTKSKWENDGWEFVSKDEGTFQTKLQFKREKAKLSKGLIGGAAGGALVLVAIIAIGIVNEGRATNPSTTNQPSPSSPVTEPSVGSETDTVDTDAKPITVENNLEFAALMATAGEDLKLNKRFFDKYRGMTLEFDGNVAVKENHGDYETRFDILIEGGEYSETRSNGPGFRLVDVGYYDLHLKGPDAPYSVSQGQNVRIVGKLVEWKDPVFTLDVISTQVR